MANSGLSGVFPVIPTPFAPDGAPDAGALLALVDFAIESGADGVVFPGMASEVETLTPAERGDLVTRVGAHIGRLVPFIVGASDPDPTLAGARAREGPKRGRSRP